MKIDSINNKCESLEVTISDFGASTFDLVSFDIYAPGSDTADHSVSVDFADLPLVVIPGDLGSGDNLTQGVYKIEATLVGGSADGQTLEAYHLNTCIIDKCLQDKRAALTDKNCDCKETLSRRIMQMEMIKKGVCWNFDNMLFSDIDSDIATLVNMCEEDDCNC